jgi:hypothetical protein
MSWQVLSLVEAMGALRGRLARVCSEHERERADLTQKLEAAKDALGRLELNEGTYGRELAKGYDEIERLKNEVARVERERDDARQLLETSWQSKGVTQKEDVK